MGEGVGKTIDLAFLTLRCPPATHLIRMRNCFFRLHQALESPLVTISASFPHTSAVRDLNKSAQLASQPVFSSAEPSVPSHGAFNSTTCRTFLQHDFPTGGQMEPSGPVSDYVEMQSFSGASLVLRGGPLALRQASAR
jgi:hypothetical protein